MEVVDQETKCKILDKLSGHINISHYYDFHELSKDEFSKKHGYWGVDQQNFREIRFYPQTDVHLQVRKLLFPNEDYFFLPIDSSRKIFTGDITFFDKMFRDQSITHFLVVDNRFNWILIKNEFSKVIGIGEQMKKRIGKMIHLSFDSEKIMYELTDSKDENANKKKSD